MTYAVLEPRGTQDAGVWSLIKETGPGQFRIMARGAQKDLQELAKQLNLPRQSLFDRLSMNQPAPLNPIEPKPGIMGGLSISRGEVEGWDEETYMRMRGRLYTNGHNTYTDGSPQGRIYTPDAARLMTGSRWDHPAMRPHSQDDGNG